MPRIVCFIVQDVSLSAAVQQANVGGTPLYKDGIQRWSGWLIAGDAAQESGGFLKAMLF